ncbi:TonB-dependent siderophore receptor [Pleurocapsa sp. CCALA 161]|uniref:TonB-dependent siderophore receptor n=1 Tax=Pleurocapsa sp. CCALA 161 TaxID=2107688 RepID=UPI000D0843C3|nr:TonB-dependent siderophore receptor [Pleurocapsa sp. CCALA 161]PSB06394.1 TonB-dependent siderophore receptor [Pleurocapsa sp. CCALA 161]
MSRVTPKRATAEQESDEQIEVIATGEAEEDDYTVDSASTATGIDTSFRDIPQSIQVVPRQVIEDRNTRTVQETVETVSGVVDNGSNLGVPTQSLTIRGFEQSGNFRNGYRDATRFDIAGGTNTIEQIEVLKGPASIQFGQIEPGGVVNVITRQPLNEPYYSLTFEAGNFDFYQPIIDLSGPLTADDKVLYRFIASYESAGSFQDFVETDFITVAPSITLNISDRTKLNFYYEYLDFNGDPPISYAVLNDGSLTPRDRHLSYPDFALADVTTQKLGYILNHEFNENWQIRNNLAVVLSDTDNREIVGASLVDESFLALEAYDADYSSDNYFGQIDLVGEFETGTIAHQLVAGFDFNIRDDENLYNFDTDLPLLDIFNPDYNISEPDYVPFFQNEGTTESYGVFLQDRIEFTNNLKLLIGGRYDWISSERETSDFGGSTPGITENDDDAFSPRIGLVYQPSDTVSLYSSYSRSFVTSGGTNADGREFEPTRGTQYEVGVRTEFLDDRLSTNLAAYHLTKTNVTTTDPDNIQFSIQTGEQRSQGIELDVTGEILPGWNIIASYAYTDAEVTADNDTPEGNQLPNVPENQASLWTTYEIQRGDLQGLGFGLGLFYIGERQGDLDNSFQINDYLRTDSALYYRRNRLKTAINIRNLFDIDYVRSSFADEIYIERGEPFTIVGSVGWEF